MAQTAEQDLQARLMAIRTAGGGQPEIDATIARNILHEDLGQFDSHLTTYGLDDATRDRLIAHSRQDAALAVLSVSTLTKEVSGLRRSISVVAALLVVLIAIEIARFFA